MNGQPVWLASISRVRNNGRRFYVPEWSPSQLRDAERRLREVVEGVGDTTKERLFRMNVTLCLHRAATDAEVAAQPKSFMQAPGCGLTGGPVHVLSETVAVFWNAGIADDICRVLNSGMVPAASARAAHLAREDRR